jgi:predicted secreted protein
MLQVSLAENSTTGYEWETEAVDSSILLYVDEQFQLDPYCGDRVGCGGTITLRFEAAGTGLTILRIVYRRTEEMGFVSDGPAVDTFEATVQVVP